jgi:hypothetical protein
MRRLLVEAGTAAARFGEALGCTATTPKSSAAQVINVAD